MEEQPIKITVMGAAIIVAAIIAVFLLLRYLNEQHNKPNPPMA